METPIEMNDDACFRVFEARDARFDGRLFVGVRTTGVYCRPICPARTPRRENVIFYRTAAAAQEAGFRPCLRCRPEVSPELASWRGTSSTVSRALRLIEAGALDEGDAEHLASRLGIGARQLRRLFAKHIGASPQSVARTRRVHLAKQLIQDSDLPMVQVALASGFGSLRRFNETFKDLFGRPPASLRRRRAKGEAAIAKDVITLRLGVAPPYAVEEMFAFLAARAIPCVEAVSGQSYARSIAIDGVPGLIRVRPSGPRELLVEARFPRLCALPDLIARIRRLFDLAADPSTIDAHLGRSPLLAPLVRARPGLRVPGAFDGFELAVRAVLGQQITVPAASRLAGRLAARFGEALPDDLASIEDGVTHLFPGPERLAEADIASLGMPRSRANTLSALAAAVLRDPALLGQRSDLDLSVRALTALPGIGEWTAQYIAMRELQEPDAFPAGDVALIRAIELLSGERPSPAALLAAAEPWRPWRAYAAIHLWASLGAPLQRSMGDADKAA